MKRSVSSALILVVILSSLPTIWALPTSNAAIDNAKMPEHAVQIAENVFSLGTAIVDGKIVEGFLFVRYKEGFAKPSGTPGNGPDKDKDEEINYYTFIFNGVNWKNPENYILDAQSGVSYELTSDEIKTTISTSFSTWENGDPEGQGFDIFGEEIEGVVDGADFDQPDGKNEIYFASIEDSGVIAFCNVWAVVRGPPKSKQLVEFDIVFDNVDFDWGNADVYGNSVMDLQNIATHEIGHALGLGDIYPEMYDKLEDLNEAKEQTMYGYALPGEIKKRTLDDDGDIVGLTVLYG